jgi:hypothetical protein
MAYVIYGVNRIAKDFLYMFPELDIAYFVEEQYEKSTFHLKEVYPVSKLERKQGDKVILCDTSEGKERKREILELKGWVYQKDFVYEEDFFSQLDEKETTINPKGKPIAIWGVGNHANFFATRFRAFTPEYFVDTYSQETFFHGTQVKKPHEIEEWRSHFYIIAVHEDAQIRQYLEDKGLVHGQDYINSEEIVALPSEMLRATIFDTNYYPLKCQTPLNHMELLTEGALYCCCSTFMIPMGNVSEGGIQNVWNSVKHKILCLSVLNQTYTFCNASMCPLLFGKKKRLGRFVADVQRRLEGAYPSMERAPLISSIGFDYTCNLCCETCRSNLRIAKEKDRKRMDAYAQDTIQELLPHANFFVMAGDGEVFFSPAYRKIYESKEMNQVPYIRLLSNGTLFNPKNWREFSKGKVGKIMLTASIDAATKQTYETIRRNGNFDEVKKNMEFAGELRRRGELAYFRMNFVVQRRNYQEMISFVKWGIEIGADEIFFTKILNWGTYTPEEFEEISMMQEDGITPKEELLAVLQDPIMQHPIVDLGTIQYGHDTTEADEIENYYMWELERKVKGLFDESECTVFPE